MRIPHVVSPIQFTSEKTWDLHRAAVQVDFYIGESTTPGTSCSPRAICSLRALTIVVSICTDVSKVV